MSVLGRSLRLRLSILILCPLIIVSVVATYWRFDGARATAEEVFDNNLVMLCLAVSRDVAHSGGDTLSETTSNLFRAASGGTVFYHVYGPDGSFVTGYSSPPVAATDVGTGQNAPILFDAVHQGTPVRAVRLAERVEIDGIAGTAVVTVWQHLQPRRSFAQTLALQAATFALVLLATVAALVIFGVRLGLRPLDELEDAIQKRSTTDLRPIEREIPSEARGIVDRLNTLFSSLTDAKAAQDRLISNAAHQLRNPVAAIHALAQATMAAKTLDDSHRRAAELVDETRAAVHLTQQMLSLERINGIAPNLVAGDLNRFVENVGARVGPKVMKSGASFELVLAADDIKTSFDKALLREGIVNLVDNALRHAGPDLTAIRLGTQALPDGAAIFVENDGAVIEDDVASQIFERFKQGRESDGAGLGLAICDDITKLHGGALTLRPRPTTRFTIFLPDRPGNGP